MAIKYRPEIDGLRGVAVVPVILFHAGFSAFGGGFVGVDVFFVISGYLITSIILTELASGTFTIARFYERRARRILPAMTVVILACLPAAWLLLPPADLIDFARSALSVALFSSNVYFKNHGDYFNAASELRPLLHTWSLGVEEQFYVIFPLVLMFAWRRARALLVPALVVAALGSLALAHWGALYRPSGAFYLLPTRAWELLIGGLTAIHLSHGGSVTDAYRTEEHATRASLMSAAGLLLIVGSILLFDSNTLMPGLPALAPIAGATLIILFASPQTLVGRLLGSRPFVGVGLISYSAYLWHQPLLSFARWSALSPPPTGTLLLVSLLSLPLAYLTWRFVETPARDRQRFDRRRVVMLAVSSSLLLMAVGGAGIRLHGAPWRFALTDETVASFRMQTAARGCSDGEDQRLRPDWLCTIGIPLDTARGGATFLLVGDSHAMALMPAFDSAARALRMSGEFTAMSACPPILDVYKQARPLEVRDCHDFNSRIADHVRTTRMPLVILVGRWSAYTDGGYAGRELRPILRAVGEPTSQARSREVVAAGLRQTVDELVAAGARVVVVSQVPEQRVDVPFKAYVRLQRLDESVRTDSLRSYSVPRALHEALQAFVDGELRAVQASGKAEVISVDDAFCDSERCLLGSARQSWYMDDHHLSQVGAFRAVPRVMTLLDRERIASATAGRRE